MTHYIRSLGFVWLLLAAAAVAPASAQPDVTDLTDTGVPGGNDLLVFGSRFISGYFDSVDVAFRLDLHDTATGTTTPIGDLGIDFFSTEIVVQGDWVVFMASEFWSLRDLNGDGDRDDKVPYVFHMPSGELASVGIAASPRGNSAVVNFAVTPEFLVFAASERNENQSGFGRDLNGDGDILDDILHYYELGTGALTNTMFDILPGSFAGAGNVVAFSEPERQVAPLERDKNGDGDILDVTPIVIDFSSGVPIRHEPKIAGGSIDVSPGGFVSIAANEISQGSDLNGNGIINELRVAFVYDSRGDALHNLGLYINLSTWSGDVLAFEVLENQQLESLNGDMDTDDVVPHFHDATTGETTTPQIASAFQLRAAPGHVLFPLREASQGVDANGDGLLNTDVLQIYRLADGRVHNTMISNVQAFMSAGDDPTRAMFPIAESFIDTDLNGDGDKLDGVLHTLEVATGELENLGVAGFGFRTSWNDRFVVPVSEFRQGEDRNGDGDLSDNVLAYFEPGLAEPINFGLVGRDVGLSREILALSLFEAQENEDLNGDGDRVDTLVMVHEFRGTPEEELMDIRETIENLDTSVQQALISHVNNAAKWLDRDNIAKTIDALTQLVHQLQKLPPSVIDPGEAQALIDDINALIDQLSALL